MVKRLLALPLLFVAFFAFGQNLKPIAQMVQQAKNAGTLPQIAFFDKQTGSITQNEQASSALRSGTLLYWDEAQAQTLRSMGGQPVSLTLPWGNGATMALDLVPARNYSPEFQAVDASGNSISADLGVHYWGTIQDNPESLVTISIFANEMVGMIAVGNERYNIGVLANDASRTHVLFRESDLNQANPFNCLTEDELYDIGQQEMNEVESRATGPTNCVRMYVEADYTLFQNKGSVANVQTYVSGVFSQVSALYANESVILVLHYLKIWDVADPYTGPSASNYLTQFRTALNGNFNGDLAHLIGIHGLGGVAYLDQLCGTTYRVGYSSINSTFSNVPTYSWTVEVITHEIGHNLGSPHTHACAWNGNNTAIDGCGPTAGYSEGCNANLPTNGGTIMSYCHLVSGVGINFNNGFGTQPGDRIRSRVYNASCLAACGSGGGGGSCTYSTLNSNGFDMNWGIWASGGVDCARISNATYANSPTYSIQLRDNTANSVMTTSNQNYTAYSELTVTFSYISVSFESGEDFWVQISTNGGTSYTTVGDYNAGTQFTNGVRGSGSVVIPGPFSNNTRIRFRADASDDGDLVYIDDVVIKGCGTSFGGGSSERKEGADVILASTDASIADLKTSPNPAADMFNIEFTANAETDVQVMLTDLTGRTVMQNRIQAQNGVNRLATPVGSLAEGLYVLTVRCGDQLMTEKVVVSRR
ncbi:MAG: T9SS type A sorting domain-containing protein [Saprospiraceae bacterium]|nr:T9SS type A sorting domain-containing protein [Saprospiraceae bacterium]